MQTITRKPDQNGNLINWISVDGGRPRKLHIVNWEKVHGKVPLKHILVCKTDNSLDADADNWQLLSSRDRVALYLAQVAASKTKNTKRIKPLKPVEPMKAIKPSAETLKRHQMHPSKTALREAKEIKLAKARKKTIAASPDLNKLLEVKIDHRTTIFIQPGRDPQMARQQYLSRHHA
jgi:hypothetical protein